MTQFRRSLMVAAAIAAAGLGFAFTLAFTFASSAKAAGCDETGATQVEIAKVTEDLDIVLKDERSIRLVGVKALSTGADRQPGASLVSFINEAAGDAKVSLRVLTPIADRWGRIPGDVFIGGRHLQSSLAQAGLAVARPDDLRGPCWAAIRAAEAQGRRDNAGVWATADAILPATDGAKLGERDGTFVMASGQVRHVSRGKGRSYVDFGARGTNALFLTIDPKALTRMEKLGFKLEQLTGRKILVRGVVLSGRSPHMVIDDLDAIEFWD